MCRSEEDREIREGIIKICDLDSDSSVIVTWLELHFTNWTGLTEKSEAWRQEAHLESSNSNRA